MCDKVYLSSHVTKEAGKGRVNDMDKDKWYYIHLISQRGSSYGNNGGVLDLLMWSGKQNTSEVTIEEAETFWEQYDEIAAKDRTLRCTNE